MRLRDWLDSAGHDAEWLARQLSAEGPRVSERTVQRWLVGDSRPRNPAHLRRIVEISSGVVTAQDIIFEPAPRRLGRPADRARRSRCRRATPAP